MVSDTQEPKVPEMGDSKFVGRKLAPTSKARAVNPRIPKPQTTRVIKPVTVWGTSQKYLCSNRAAKGSEITTLIIRNENVHEKVLAAMKLSLGMGSVRRGAHG